VSDIGLEELVARLGEVVVVDVRTRSEFDGSAGSPCDPRQGHLPGARHLDVSRMVDLDGEAIAAALDLAPGVEVVAYCHSGTRSAIATQILRSLGHDARNYVGSWHEWSRHEELPVER
jgi:thiosulfate/3-mercaptopyruvate sulfurtransferase